MSKEAKIITLIGLALGLLVVGAAFLLGDKPAEDGSGTNLIREDSYKIGSDSARVKIVEFADFQCPACKAVHPVTKKIIEDYQDKIFFVYRHFPLPRHQNAHSAALASEAAGKQGKFWEMHNHLFTNQSSWENLSDPTEQFTAYAKELGLEEANFKNDLGDAKIADKIKRDSADGSSLLVNATPTFFLNGEKISGGLSYNDFKKRIDSMLK